MRVRGASSLGYNLPVFPLCLLFFKKNVVSPSPPETPPHLDADANVDLIRTLGWFFGIKLAYQLVVKRFSHQPQYDDIFFGCNGHPYAGTEHGTSKFSGPGD